MVGSIACGQCGDSFLPRQNHGKLQQFCSQQCAYAARRKPAPKPGQYRMLYLPGHPLAGKAKYLPEHRVLLWNRIGPGPHPCHYCGTLIDWLPGEYTKKGALGVDHIDRNRANNNPSNLVPSCQACNNRNTSRTVLDEEPFVARANGTRLRGESRDCMACGVKFITYPDPRPNRGLYCSRSCARRKPAAHASTFGTLHTP